MTTIIILQIELKVRLLYNLVSVSAENPGKLIPNYNTPDNPLMEFLNKSLALSESLEKLKKIPGFEKLAERIINSKKKNLNKWWKNRLTKPKTHHQRTNNLRFPNDFQAYISLVK